MLDAIKGIFKKKRKLIAIMIDETGTVTQKKKKYENSLFHDKTSFNAEKEAYIVDHNFMCFDAKTHLPVAFYAMHNPQPLRMKHAPNPEVNAVGFQHILDNKAIQDLFSNQGLGTLFWVLVLVGFNILFTFIMIGIQTGYIKVHA